MSPDRYPLDSLIGVRELWRTLQRRVSTRGSAKQTRLTLIIELLARLMEAHRLADSAEQSIGFNLQARDVSSVGDAIGFAEEVLTGEDTSWLELASGSMAAWLSRRANHAYVEAALAARTSQLDALLDATEGCLWRWAASEPEGAELDDGVPAVDAIAPLVDAVRATSPDQRLAALRVLLKVLIRALLPPLEQADSV